MGEKLSAKDYTPKQRTAYRQRLAADLEAFDSHLLGADFADHGTIGLELELNLVDSEMQPAPVNGAVLERLNDEYQSEIGSFNLELNHPHLTVGGHGLADLEAGINQRVKTISTAAAKSSATPVMIGTLPTLTDDFLHGDTWLTPENRYEALNNAILTSRGELISIDVSEAEHYRGSFETIAPEASCTSVQLHLQVAPDRFTHVWNASQAIAGIQAALAANSPLFLGHRVWDESRIAVFPQAIDTRTPELAVQGVRPRVWFGERWITSVFDLFEENVRYFPPLIPESREASGTPVMRGSTPALHYLNLHNGTVWRWNRPIYAPSEDGPAHLRIENRLLPAGPSVVDTVADAAFYYGLVRRLSRQPRPVWSRLSFADAERNFLAGARSGLFSRQVWPKIGRTDISKLITGTLIDEARAGLNDLDVDPQLIERYLGIISERARTRQNGATWQLRTLASVSQGHTKPGTPEREAALAETLRLYIAHQATGEPVHTWTIGA